jgi:hypothetical protein
MSNMTALLKDAEDMARELADSAELGLVSEVLLKVDGLRGIAIEIDLEREQNQ